MKKTTLSLLTILATAASTQAALTTNLVAYYDFEDLNNSPDVMRKLLSIDWYRGYVKGRQFVMIGYSDSAKDAGALAAGWAQYQSQEALVAIADEFDVEKGWISMDSPVARALMKKSLDDEVSVQRPAGQMRYIVTGIRYAEDES